MLASQDVDVRRRRETQSSRARPRARGAGSLASRARAERAAIASEPSNVQTPNAASSRPISPPVRPCRLPRTSTTKSTPGMRKVAAARRGTPRCAGTAGPRESGSLRRPVCASARALDFSLPPGTASASRAARRIENAYDTASARNGIARPSPKSAPPSGGPTSRTIDDARPLRADRRRQLAARHDRTQSPDLAGREEDGARSLDERDERDLPERRSGAAGSSRRGSQSRPRARRRLRSSSACDSTGRRRARRRSAKSASGMSARKRDDAGLRRRVRQREHEQRIRDRRQLRARCSTEAGRLEQNEVAVAAQRNLARSGRRATIASGRDVDRHPPASLAAVVLRGALGAIGTAAPARARARARRSARVGARRRVARARRAPRAHGPRRGSTAPSSRCSRRSGSSRYRGRCRLLETWETGILELARQLPAVASSRSPRASRGTGSPACASRAPNCSTWTRSHPRLDALAESGGFLFVHPGRRRHATGCAGRGGRRSSTTPQRCRPRTSPGSRPVPHGGRSSTSSSRFSPAVRRSSSSAWRHAASTSEARCSRTSGSIPRRMVAAPWISRCRRSASSRCSSAATSPSSTPHAALDVLRSFGDAVTDAVLSANPAGS